MLSQPQSPGSEVTLALSPGESEGDRGGGSASKTRECGMDYFKTRFLYCAGSKITGTSAIIIIINSTQCGRT